MNNDGELMEREEDARLDMYLTFAVADEEYGIDIRSVTEIIGMQPIRTLPESPDFVRGIVNLRGKIIPVVDMRLRLGNPETAYTDRTCIVVVETTRMTAGLIVDEVSEVMVIEQGCIVPPPDVQLEGSRRFISGIGKVGETVKLLIDCEKLFDISEMKSMVRISKENKQNV